MIERVNPCLTHEHFSLAPDIRDTQCGGCVSAQFPSPPAEVINPPVGTVAFQVAEFTPHQPYAQQWNLSLQRELFGGVTLTTAYVGSKGTNLQVQRNVNARFPEILPDGRKLHRTSTPRPNLNFGDLDFWEFSSSSNYHGLNAGLKKRFAGGLQFQASYTWGRSIDWASRVNFSDIQENLGKFPQDQYDVKGSNRGLSAHQVQHNFNYVWETPYEGDGMARHLLGGWQMNGILPLSTGNPESVRIGGTGGTFDWNRDGETSSLAGRTSLVPGRDQNTVLFDGRNPDRYFDARAFTLPEPGFHGNVGRNVIIGPGISTFDFSLFKNFDLAEETRLQFRAEFFNLFNRTNFGAFDNRIASSVRTESVPCSTYGSTQGDAGCSRVRVLPDGTRDITYRSTAGRITQTRTTNRQIQFGLRLVF